jgi:hypothetical protein
MVISIHLLGFSMISKDLNCNRLMGYFGAWDLTRALSMTHSLSMLGLEWHKMRAGCAVKPLSGKVKKSVLESE